MQKYKYFVEVWLNLALDSSFTLQWRSINTYFIAGFCTKNFPKLWGIFFQCLKNRMANLKEYLWELSLVLLNRNPETPGSRKMLYLALSLLHFLSKSEPKGGVKMGKILQTPCGEFHLNTLLGGFQLCSWDHKKTRPPAWLQHLAFQFFMKSSMWWLLSFII